MSDQNFSHTHQPAAHKAEPRANTAILQRGIDAGFATQKCKCGRRIIEVQRHGVAGFGPDAFFWRHAPRRREGVEAACAICGDVVMVPAGENPADTLCAVCSDDEADQ